MDKSLLYMFAPIKGHERYGVNAVGEVINFKNKRLLRQSNVNGYKTVNLDGVQYYVHRLVAKEFVPNDTPERFNVTHIDGDRGNNIIFNLRWANCSEIQTRQFKKPIKASR